MGNDKLLHNPIPIKNYRKMYMLNLYKNKCVNCKFVYY